MDEKNAKPKGSPYGRRDFLSFSWKVLGIGLLAEAAWTSYDILAPKPSGAFGGVVDTGSLIDFKSGASPKYFFDGRFYISYQGDTLVALYQKCPHLGCRVPFCDSSKQFECPCHGSVFNALGEYVKGPAPRGMDQFRAFEQNGHVMVDTGKVIEGPSRGVQNWTVQPAGPPCVTEPGAAGPATPSSGPTSSPTSGPSGSP